MTSRRGVLHIFSITLCVKQLFKLVNDTLVTTSTICRNVTVFYQKGFSITELDVKKRTYESVEIAYCVWFSRNLSLLIMMSL